MFQRSFVVPMMLSLGVALFVADIADAQIFGRVRGRGASGGVRVDSSGAYLDQGDLRGLQDMQSYPRDSFYFSPSMQTIDGEQLPPDSASIRVILPNPEARVFFDGAATKQMGTDRWFHTPPLQASAQNRYKIRATWMEGGREMSQERDVSVAPNRISMVRFDMQQRQGERLQQGGERLPQPSREPSPLPDTTPLEGKIISTGENQFVVETRDNRKVTVHTAPTTTYLLNQKTAAFTDIRVGNTVNVTYSRQGERYNATAITIRPQP
jgi:uncharacterized protein (TIGR03000 family)